MPKKLTDEEYYRTLPKKQVGTAVLLFDARGDLLVLKPDYKDSWLVPGGSADQGESPLRCAIRETREETGLEVRDLRLVGVFHSVGDGVREDSLKFVFDGGTLSADQIASIMLPSDELEAYRFVPAGEAIPMLSDSLQRCLPACLEAIKTGMVAHIEGERYS